MGQVRREASSSHAGRDFGTRERVMVLPDLTFIDLLQEREAVAYGQIPSFGLLVDVPTIYLVFRNEESAAQCFNIFGGWIEGSGQEAVHVSFLERDDGSHGIVFAPEIDKLLERTVPSNVRDEYDPIIFAPNIMIEIPAQSDGFRWFKAVASGRPFVVAPATAAGGPLMNLAFRKREAVLHKEDKVPQVHPAHAHVQRRQSTAPAPSAPVPTAGEVAERRARQLKRFFPVTLERLRSSAPFSSSLAALVGEGFERWQIYQAACNLTLRYRHPHLYSNQPGDSSASAPSVLGFLLDYPETVGDAPLPEGDLGREVLLEQILADSWYLLHYLAPDTPDDLPTPAVLDGLRHLGMFTT